MTSPTSNVVTGSFATLAQAPTSDQLLTGSVPAPGTAVATPTGAAPTGAAGSAGGGGPAPTSPGLGMFFPLVLMMVVLIGFTMFGARRDRKKRQALADSLKRGDEVVTTGGIIGTISELRDDEVVLRIDVNSNAKMRITRSAIQFNRSSAAGAASIEKSDADAPNAGVEVKSGKKGVKDQIAV